MFDLDTHTICCVRLRRRNVCPLCLCEDAAEAVKHDSDTLQAAAGDNALDESA